MATYNTAFGSLPGYNEMLGTTNTTGGGQQQVYGQRAQQQRQQQQQPAPAQTFSQMQQRGMARPAPPTAPQAQPFAQYGGSQQAQQMRQRLQEQLQQFGQAPSRFDTQAFQQIRGAQAANLQQEYQGQLQALNEELARRGLSASSVGGGRMGDLAGQQARALASLDAELLQRAAETQAQDRAQLLSEGRGLAELASAQDLAQFEANRVAQAATFENQLRAAQFGQQQFEQAGQEAFQGAQAEEAAQQAARAFDLQATGQAAGLSMDLQRLLGQQELERAQLTGQLGGAQTLAAQQQAEQRRQFDIQQMLQQQLGLGGLSLEQQRFAEQARQFGVTSAEEQRQFNIQQALQQQLGLGGLEVQRGQLGVEQQRLAQQGEQFRAQLDEQQAARLQQGGFTTTELAIKRQQVDNELALQNRQLSETERNNLAIRGLQRDQFESEKDFRSQQLGLNRDELEQRANQIKEDQRLRGVEIDDQRAYRDAEIDLRTTQISNEYTRAGQQIDLEKARIQAQKDISSADNTAQMERLKAQVASQEKVATLETQLRRQLGMMEATGQVYQTGEGAAVTQAGGLTQAALQNAYARAAQLTQATGLQHTVNPTTGAISAGGMTEQATLQRAELTGLLGTTPTLQRLQQALQESQFLTAQTGNLYQVGAGGIIQAGGQTTIGGQQASFERAQAAAQAQTAATGEAYTVSRDPFTGMYSTVAMGRETEAKRQFNLETNLRKQLGLSELFGQMYSPEYGAFMPGQETIGRQTARSQQTIAEAQQRMAQDELQSRLREQLIRVLSSFPIPTATK